ncbi:NAD(P)/FAD-dependent oxidoreductase [Luedemannella helvata]|uniref:Flavin monoamine oxidase family protein n=1 Tax=Luedemannella helvata TaxID=349315 RepID=A0ABN2JUD2_9ACTN
MRTNGPPRSAGTNQQWRGRYRFTVHNHATAAVHERHGPPRPGATVAVVGAGVAGLVAAYELEQLGYNVVVLEGSRRCGGRIFSYRFAGPHADSPIAELGAMRFPARHIHTMGYVARLGLSDELRPFKSLLADDNALHGTTGGYLRLREAPRALMAELRDALLPRDYRDATLLFAAQLSLIVDAIAPPTQREGLRHDLHNRLLDHVESIDLRAYLTGHGETGIDLHGVFGRHPELRSACGGDLNTFLDDILTETSAELLRIRGGMARLTDRLARRLRRPILYAREVIGMNVQPDGVVLTIRAPGRTLTRHCQTVVCTAPLPVLRRMRLSGFPADKLDIIHGVKYVPATKIAFHCREAFWEREGITGGASFSGGRVRQTYYPAIDGDRALGAVLLASYTIGDEAEEWGAMSPHDRHAAVVGELSRMHPQLRDPGMVLNAVSLAWGRNKWSGSGCSVRWGKTLAEQEEERLAVARPVGPLFFAGEHCSSAPAWIDGAIQSAIEAVGQIVRWDSRAPAPAYS